MKTPHSIPTPGDLYPYVNYSVEQDDESTRTPIDQLTTAVADVMMDINTYETAAAERLNDLTGQTLEALDQLALTSNVLQEIELNDDEAALTNRVVAQEIQDLRSLRETYNNAARIGTKDSDDGNSPHTQLVHLQTQLDQQIGDMTIKTATGEQKIDFSVLETDDSTPTDESPELTLTSSLRAKTSEQADSAHSVRTDNDNVESSLSLTPSILALADERPATTSRHTTQASEELTLTPSLLAEQPEATLATELNARQSKLTELANDLQLLEAKKRDLDAIIADDATAAATGDARPAGRRRASSDELSAQRSALEAQIAALMTARVTQLQYDSEETDDTSLVLTPSLLASASALAEPSHENNPPHDTDSETTPVRRTMGRFATFMAGRRTKREANRIERDTQTEKPQRHPKLIKGLASAALIAITVLGIKAGIESNQDAPVADPHQNTQESPNANQSVEDSFGNISLQPSPNETSATPDKSSPEENVPKDVTVPKTDTPGVTPDKPHVTSQPPTAEAHSNIIDINSDAFIIPRGGGGEQLMRSLGLSSADWYANHLDHKLQTAFPDVFYSVGHGKHRDVRIAKPGELPQNVKQFIIDHTANN